MPEKIEILENETVTIPSNRSIKKMMAKYRYKKTNLSEWDLSFKVKCNRRLLDACNQTVEGLQGEKVHLIKILSYYCYIRTKISSGHIHNINKIPEEFKDIKKLFHNNTFKKYNKLMLKHGFAYSDGTTNGLKIKSLEKVTDSFCDSKKPQNEKYIKIKFDENKDKLKDLHSHFLKLLFDNTMTKVLKADELNHVPHKTRKFRREALRDEHQKKYFNYFETTINLSNKSIGKMFNMSSHYASKFKNHIRRNWKNKDIQFEFVNHTINYNRMESFIESHPDFRFYSDSPTYYINKFTAVKNFGQRLIILPK
jgi:hypothetical protein